MCNDMKYSNVNVFCNLCGWYRNCNTILYNNVYFHDKEFIEYCDNNLVLL